MQKKINQLLSDNLGHKPTSSQEYAISILSDFIFSGKDDDTVLLRGYAGTGKTTLISSLVRSLQELKIATILMAPTGRAAKVLASYSGKAAFTLHKMIYAVVVTSSGMQIVPAENRHRDTLFIVDEASMIGNDLTAESGASFGNRRLLDDLFQYVYNGNNCKLLIVGDSAQLPPVGTPLSPVLDAGFIARQYNIECNECELTEVVRQEAGSGILNNATLLRKQISNTTCNFPFFNLSGFKDIRSINGSELEDCLYTEYSRFGMREVMVINRSNKNANLYNLQIRARILQLEGELQAGELLMIVRNNYFWLPENNCTSFIANGDILEVMKVNREIELHGFRFAHIRARLCDYDEIPEFETIIMLDTLHLDSPALDNARSKALYESVAQDYLDVKSNAARIKKIHQDPYLNALQVKYAYAVTCHKAQGGQWPAVFVDQGYLSDQIVQSDYLRWLYTAVTRATDTLYLVNFHKKLLEKN